MGLRGGGGSHGCVSPPQPAPVTWAMPLSPPGIVASNTRDTDVGATYPHLNFCIPATVLQPPVMRYHRTGNPDAFATLNRAGEGVRAAWRLQRQPGPPSKL